MLKLYSDQQYRLPEHVPVHILYPFWESSRTYSPFGEYIQVAPTLFQMTALEDADLAILPTDWRHYRSAGREQLAQEFVTQARRAGKVPVVFFNSDSAEDIPLDAVIFRNSFYRSTRKPNEFALPGWVPDIVETELDGQLSIRPKGVQPVVGFCGKARATWRERGLHYARNAAVFAGLRERRHRSAPLRARILRQLSNSPLIETAFIYRDRFLATYIVDRLDMPADMKRQIRQEYISNLVNSDYVVSVRGAGNYSLRFYETLCCGRVPLFFDTDCVLPFDFHLDWKRYCVWVAQGQHKEAARILADHHATCTPETFEQMQHGARTLWLQWLSPAGFFTNFYRHFEDSISVTV